MLIYVLSLVPSYFYFISMPFAASDLSLNHGEPPASHRQALSRRRSRRCELLVVVARRIHPRRRVRRRQLRGSSPSSPHAFHSLIIPPPLLPLISSGPATAAASATTVALTRAAHGAASGTAARESFSRHQAKTASCGCGVSLPRFIQCKTVTSIPGAPHDGSMADSDRSDKLSK